MWGYQLRKKWHTHIWMARARSRTHYKNAQHKMRIVRILTWILDIDELAHLFYIFFFISFFCHLTIYSIFCPFCGLVRLVALFRSSLRKCTKHRDDFTERIERTKIKWMVRKKSASNTQRQRDRERAREIKAEKARKITTESFIFIGIDEWQARASTYCTLYL